MILLFMFRFPAALSLPAPSGGVVLVEQLAEHGITPEASEVGGGALSRERNFLGRR